MQSDIIRSGRALVLSVACALSWSATLAEKPEWAGDGNRPAQKEKPAKVKDGKKAPEIKIGAYFGDQQRLAAKDYYARHYSAKRCPPGLAKKNNGCMPPGQARKWAVGQPLPTDVSYYPVPQALVLQLGVPPAGHRYVRVANDIVLIAIASRLVIDAIEDLMMP